LVPSARRNSFRYIFLAATLI
jgi:hypothetical protein